MQQQLYIKVFNVQRTGTGKHEFGVTTYDCYFLMPNETKKVIAIQNVGQRHVDALL